MTHDELRELTAHCNEAIRAEYELFGWAEIPTLTPGMVRALLPVLGVPAVKPSKPDISAFVERVRTALHALSVDGALPTTAVWNSSKPDGLPTVPVVMVRLCVTTWGDLAPMFGLTYHAPTRRGRVRRRGATQETDSLPSPPAVPVEPAADTFTPDAFRAALHAFAEYGYMPAPADFDARRPAYLPTMEEGMRAVGIPHLEGLARWADLKHVADKYRVDVLKRAKVRGEFTQKNGRKPEAVTA